MDGVGHIDLGALAGNEILLCTGLAGHLMDEGDGLRLGGEHIVIAVRRNCVQQRFGAGHCQLGVAEHDERADIELVADLTEREFPLQSGDLHSIRHCGEPPFAI